VLAPQYYIPNDATRVAARKAARELLSSVFADRVNNSAMPAFVVVSNTVVTADTLDSIGNSVSTCPHCSLVHSTQSTDDGLPPDDNPTDDQIPKAFYVDVTIRIPASKLIVKDVAPVVDILDVGSIANALSKALS